VAKSKLRFRRPVSGVSARLMTLTLSLVCLSSMGYGQEESWRQFRGPGGLPVSDNPGLPSKWSTTENIEWATEIPGLGWSSPIVWEGKVFVTSARMKQGKTEEEVEELITARDSELPDEVELTYNLFCIELESGEILWKRDFFYGPPPVGRHRKNSYTSETPVTDGERIYVYVAFLGLYAFDFEGNQLWSTPLKANKVYLDFGCGASPAQHGDQLFILNDNQEESYIAAFDKRTGEPLWRTLRTGLGSDRMRSGWSTPFVWENERSGDQLQFGWLRTVANGTHVAHVDPEPFCMGGFTVRDCGICKRVE